MIIKIVLLVLLIGPFQPSSSSIIIWSMVEHSRVYFLLRPYEREVKLWATNAMNWDVVDYRSTILIYYRLLYDSILHNDLDKAARYCGVLLALLLKAKGLDSDKYISYIDAVDWDQIRILDMTPEEMVDLWLTSRAEDRYEVFRLYASVSLSLLERMPVNSFIRILNTPYLREMYVVNLALILLTSAYFVFKKSRLEGGGVELEAPP